MGARWSGAEADIHGTRVAGSVSVNGVKIGPDTRLGESHLLHGSLIALRRGKKAWHLTRWA